MWTMRILIVTLSVLLQNVFVKPAASEMPSLVAEMKHKMFQGQGETFYDVGQGSRGPSGLSEENLETSLANVRLIADRADADLTVLRRRGGDVGKVAECLVRTRMSEDDFMEIRYIHFSENRTDCAVIFKLCM